MKELVLFGHTQPELIDGLVVKKGLADRELPESATNTVRNLTLQLESRKAFAKRMGLSVTKENAPVIDAAIAKAQNELKIKAVAEFTKAAMSPEWTGSLFRVQTNKSGTEQKLTVQVKSVNRTAALPSREQVVKYLATLSESDQMKVLETAEDVQKQGNATEVETVIDKEKTKLVEA